MQKFRDKFPFFKGDWIYLDSASTTLKPKILLDTTNDFYQGFGSVHRSFYDLNNSESFENARNLLAKYLHTTKEQIVWNSGTTQGLNTLALGFSYFLKQDDEILISVAEHHSNFLPWVELAKRTGARVKILELNENLQIDVLKLKQQLNEKVKIVAFNLISNVTGVEQNANEIIQLIKKYSKALVVLDIAQAVKYGRVDTKALGVDFYTLSAHKMFGPTGLGALIGNNNSLEMLKPCNFGGKMALEVTENNVILAPLPQRLEAGTPNIAGVVGFEAVLKWLLELDFENLNADLTNLANDFYDNLSKFEDIKIISPKGSKILSFKFKNIQSDDLNTLLALEKIALRSGTHCASPLISYLKQSDLMRVSLAYYNNENDLQQFLKSLAKCIDMLK